MSADKTNLVSGAEVVVEAQVVLVAVDVVPISIGQVETFDTTHKPNARQVQAVAGRGCIEWQRSTACKVVGCRHPGKRLSHVWAVVKSRPEWITAEHANGLQWSSRSSRSNRIAIDVNRGIVRRRIAVLHSREKPEDALLRQGRQRRTCEILALEVPLAFEVCEEKRLVFDDRPAKTRSILVPVVITLRVVPEVVEPAIGRIMVCPVDAASELVGSRPGHHLHVPRTA